MKDLNICSPMDLTTVEDVGQFLELSVLNFQWHFGFNEFNPVGGRT